MVHENGVVSHNLLAEVRTLLKDHPKGMTVTEIAAGLGLNRNSTAKYLDILAVAGQIEMRSFGPAKVYFLSQRVPLGAILNYAKEFILVLNHQYRIVQVNDRFLEYLGSKREDLLGQSIDEIDLPIISDPRVRNRMLEARSEGEVMLELEAGPAEAARYFLVRLVSTVFDDGSAGITCIIEEITERKRAELDLQERERRFREVVEFSPFPSAIADATGRLLYVNTRFVEAFGYSAEECGTVKNWFGLAHPDPDYRDHTDGIWRSVVRDGSIPEPSILHVRTRTGEVREVVFHLRRLSDGNLYLIYEDISELRRLEDALAERRRLDDALFRSFRRLTEITEAGRNLLFSASLDGVLSYVSPLFERLTGRRAAALVGTSLIDLLPGSDGGIVEELTGQIVTGGTVEGLEMHLSGPEGRDDFIIVNLSPTRGGTGEITGFDGVLVLRSGRHG
ncbi:MAG TPA: PAS domain S-box protein [Methanoregulaceae archaeon]|nr:PAS domain S-box protein [Methanoregulaceae archaeon]